MPERQRALSSGPLLARNVALNLAGWGFPALLALVAIPLLVHGMGTARFGVLVLVWAVIGYFSLFDMGLGRALTQLLAQRLGRDGADSASSLAGLTWTALALMVPLGIAGGAALALLAPWLAHDLLHIPPALRGESLKAFVVVALALPFTVSTAGFRGVLEATQRFDLVNLLRVPMGLLTFVGPLATLPFSRSLVPAVAVIAGGRIVIWAAHWVVCRRVFPALRGRVTLVGREVRPLLRFGGWMTVSNIVSPLMVSMDRFVVGAVLTVSAVAFYATPQEVVTKFWLFTAAVLPVLFPALATTYAVQPARTAAIFERGARIIFLALLPPVLVLVTLAHEGLGLWLGAEFARQSTTVLQVLAIAVFVNSVGQAAFTLIQATGRPDITGKLHLAELPVYAVMLWWALERFGITGVALAWAIRQVLDTALLLVAAARILPAAGPATRRAALALTGACALLAAAAALGGTRPRIAALALLLPLLVFASWRYGIKPEERALIGPAILRYRGERVSLKV